MSLTFKRFLPKEGQLPDYQLSTQKLPKECIIRVALNTLRFAVHYTIENGGEVPTFAYLSLVAANEEVYEIVTSRLVIINGSHLWFTSLICFSNTSGNHVIAENRTAMNGTNRSQIVGTIKVDYDTNQLRVQNCCQYFLFTNSMSFLY